MKRLEVLGKSFQFTDDHDPQYKSLSIQVQVLRGQFNFVRAEFFIEGQELQTFLSGDRDYEKLAEDKMRWILELHTTPVDAYLLETMQREQREILGSVEETKVAAMEAARAEAEAKIAEKDEEIAMLQQMIVELTLMLSMIRQGGAPEVQEPGTEEPEPDPGGTEQPIEKPPAEETTIDEEPEDPPAEEPPTEEPTVEESPSEDPLAEEPPQEDPDIPPEEGAPDDPEPETPADPVADDPDTTPIDEGGEGGE